MSGAGRDDELELNLDVNDRRTAAEAEEAGTEGHLDDRLFATLEEADTALKRYAFEQGFGATRCRSSNKGGPEKIYRCYTYTCAKGIGRASTATKYKTSTQKVGCLWAASISSTKRDQWQWSIRIKSGAHNHDAVDEPSSLAPLRKLTDPMKKLIRSLRDNIPGSTRRSIYNTLKAEYPLAIFIIKDVDNYMQRLHREDLRGRTPIQHPINSLKDNNIIHRVDYQVDGDRIAKVGPNGVLLTGRIVWDTPTSAPQAVVPTPSTVVERSGADDLCDFGFLEDGAKGFGPSDPDVEIVETLHNEDGSMITAGPKPTNVAGAFGGGGGPALGTDFSPHGKPVVPNSRHRQKNKPEMKVQKKKGKNEHKSLQGERMAYLAGLAAKKAAAEAEASQ